MASEVASRRLAVRRMTYIAWLVARGEQASGWAGVDIATRRWPAQSRSGRNQRHFHRPDRQSRACYWSGAQAQDPPTLCVGQGRDRRYHRHGPRPWQRFRCSAHPPLRRSPSASKAAPARTSLSPRPRLVGPSRYVPLCPALPVTLSRATDAVAFLSTNGSARGYHRVISALRHTGGRSVCSCQAEYSCIRVPHAECALMPRVVRRSVALPAMARPRMARIRRGHQGGSELP
jgi:hypothetical protein